MSGNGSPYGQGQGYGQNYGGYGLQSPQTAGGYGQQYQQAFGSPQQSYAAQQQPQYGRYNPYAQGGAMGGPSGYGGPRYPQQGGNPFMGGGQNQLAGTFGGGNAGQMANGYRQPYQPDMMKSTQSPPLGGPEGGLLSGVMGGANVGRPTVGKSAPMPAQQALTNANQNAAFNRPNDGSVVTENPYGLTRKLSPSAMTESPPANDPAQHGAPINWNGTPYTIDPRSMNFILNWGGYGNYGQDSKNYANYYNQQYGGQAPGGPTNWDR